MSNKTAARHQEWCTISHYGGPCKRVETLAERYLRYDPPMIIDEAIEEPTAAARTMTDKTKGELA